MITLPTIRQLFELTFRRIRQRFSVLVGLSLFTGLFVFGLTFFLDSIVQLIEANNVRALLQQGFFTTVGVFLGLHIVSLLVIGIISSLGQVALIEIVADKTNKMSVRVSFERSFRRFLKYWWVMLLSGLITLGGLFLLVVPGILFSVWFIFTGFIVVLEERGSLGSVIASREYVKGHFLAIVWRFLGLLFFFGPIIVVFYVILRSLLIHGTPSSGMTPEFFVFNVLVAIFLQLITLFCLVYWYVLYENLQGVKKSIDASFMKKQRIKFLAVGLVGNGLVLIMLVLIIAVFAPVATEYAKLIFLQNNQSLNSQMGAENRMGKSIFLNKIVWTNAALNAKRRVDISYLLSGINRYQKKNIDDQSELLNRIPDQYEEISKEGVDLCSLLVPEYMSFIPNDPSFIGSAEDCKTDYKTGYFIKRNDSVVYISAPSAKQTGVEVTSSAVVSRSVLRNN